jgi:RNA-binding protein YhbY|tara:strand:- start:6973 stop:7194 length:222 start_codon:yes stop_codon:yes gene_type:complete
MGKNGITENFITSLKNCFKSHDNIKVSVLKGSTRDREEIKEYSEEILNKLGKNYTSRIIGFTIVLKKWRKDVK